MSTSKLLMSWATVQLVIMDAANKPGGATWKEIKDAIYAEGWEPADWLTQVRGPLQGLINDGVIRRVDKSTSSEMYVPSSQEH